MLSSDATFEVPVAVPAFLIPSALVGQNSSATILKATVGPWLFGQHVIADSSTSDAYDMVEWAGTQKWSTGKVAMCGISYYGMSCYWAAMHQPPHLGAIVPYEALTDMYGDVCRQGGLWHSGFQRHWFNNIVLPQQYGKVEGLSDQ